MNPSVKVKSVSRGRGKFDSIPEKKTFGDTATPKGSGRNPTLDDKHLNLLNLIKEKGDMTSDEFKAEVIREQWRNQEDGVFSSEVGHKEREVSNQAASELEFGECFGCSAGFCF